IKTVNVTNVYVNSRVTNAVTVVHRDTFLTGKQMKVDGRPANPFVPGARVSPGRPDIRPVKATALPLPEKVVPARALPSQNVVEKVKATEIQKRTLAVKNDVSVFKPGKHVTPLPVNRLEKPKPVMKSEKHQRVEPSVTKKEVPERPQAAPQEPVRKPIEQPKGKVMPTEQKQIKARPVTTPRESTGREQIQKKETGKPAVQSERKERPVIVPKERTVTQPVQQRGSEKIQKQKEIKNVPSGTPRGEMKNLPEKSAAANKQNKKQKELQEKTFSKP
ncbi:MAG: FecR domain protein, partial [Nitrospirae bacterium]|nr:FecR domain protein [Nitrospirota bacterium]